MGIDMERIGGSDYGRGGGRYKGNALGGERADGGYGQGVTGHVTRWGGQG